MEERDQEKIKIAQRMKDWAVPLSLVMMVNEGIRR